jgi:hypothetical protein
VSVNPADASPPCSGARICEGRVLRACVDGHVGDPIDCASGDECSRDRCTSSACATVEHDKNGFAGCVFYTVEVNNVDSDARKATSFLVTNPGAETADVTFERYVGATWSSVGTTTIAAGAAARLPIAGLEIETAGPHDDGGLRLTASQPVTVAQIQSDDSNHDASSSGGTMLLPVQVLGHRHLVMVYPQKQTAAIAALPSSPGGAGRLLVVGTEAGTKVVLKVSAHASAVVAGSFPTVPAGGEFPEFTLNEGEVFQVWSGGDDQDLSGTEIKATAPVAVFSGNITTTYGRTGIDVYSPDMVHEQMPPTAHWSFKYVAAALPPQASTCDTLLGQAGMSLWRIMAANDNTQVEFTSPYPGRPVHANTTLKAGEVIEMMADVDFVVKGTNGPLLVTQGIDCEPSLSLAISADQLLEDVTFSVLPSFDQMVAIVRMQGEPVRLDNFAVDDASFAPAGGGYEVARVLLQPPCRPSELVCTHRLQGRFGMTLRGMDVLASYALTAPAWKGCNDPSDCVN